jgi:hypothetical protein
MIIHDAYPSITPATLDAWSVAAGGPSRRVPEFLWYTRGYPEPADFEITHRDGA